MPLWLLHRRSTHLIRSTMRSEQRFAKRSRPILRSRATSPPPLVLSLGRLATSWRKKVKRKPAVSMPGSGGQFDPPENHNRKPDRQGCLPVDASAKVNPSETDPSPFSTFTSRKGVTRACVRRGLQAGQAASLDDYRRRMGDNAAELAQIAPSLRRIFPDISQPLELPPAQQGRYVFQSVTGCVFSLP